MKVGELRDLENKKVMYVETTNVPLGIASTFHDLESKLPTLKQRKFFGIMFGDRYWAAVEVTPQDNPQVIEADLNLICQGTEFMAVSINCESLRITLLGLLFCQQVTP